MTPLSFDAFPQNLHECAHKVSEWVEFNINLTSPETEVPKVCRWRYGSISVFARFFESHTKVLNLQARIKNLTYNYSHSLSFKVTYFAISGKPRRKSMSLYIILVLALSLKVPKIASESAENCHYQQSLCRLTPSVLTVLETSPWSKFSLVVGLSVCADFVILACVILTQWSVMDGRTSRP